MPSFDNFDYQAPVAPLNEAGGRALEDLARNGTSSKKFQDQLRKSIEQLTRISSQINDRGKEQEDRHKEKQTRLARQQVQEDEDERRHFEDFQRNVQMLTNRMDHSIRKVIDHQTWHEDLPDMLKEVRKPSANAVHADDEDEEGQDATQQAPAPSAACVESLQKAFDARSSAWQSKSLTVKYANNNEYRGWYRAVWDAKNPGETSEPMPDPVSWFASEEGRVEPGSQGLRATQRLGDDDEIEIAAEKTRITCPITLRPYNDPVTSEVCNHSFEKSAILEMFQTTDLRVHTAEERAEIERADRRSRAQKAKQLGIPQVRCPECNAPFLESSLKPNPGLQIRVRRIVNAKRKQEERQQSEEDSEDEASVYCTCPRSHYGSRYQGQCQRFESF